MPAVLAVCFFFFNDTATTEIYTLSLHDALPIWMAFSHASVRFFGSGLRSPRWRSEEHTSELQSPMYLVCRLLLEKKQNKHINKKVNTKMFHLTTRNTDHITA